MNDLTGHDTHTQLLIDLVSAKSYSGEEGPAAIVFDRYAKELGYESVIDEVGNAIAHRGASGEDAQIHIVLLGHIDTVPGEIPVRIEDGILYGRGAVDAKGPIAAMLSAVSQATLPEHVRVTVAGAVGEEASGSIGARHLVDQWRPDACIIGEPSGYDGVTLGYKGRLLVDAKATCDHAHSAGKDPSANDELFAWWASVQSQVNEFNEGSNRAFDQIQATILDMSHMSDGFVEHGKIHTGFRLPETIDPQQYAERLSSMANNVVELSFSGFEKAYSTTRNDPVVRSLSSAIRTQGVKPRPKLKTGTADFNVVGPVWNCPIAAYGPGDSALDHTPNEHLSLKEYRDSIEILRAAIESLASELAQNRSVLGQPLVM